MDPNKLIDTMATIPKYLAKYLKLSFLMLAIFNFEDLAFSILAIQCLASFTIATCPATISINSGQKFWQICHYLPTSPKLSCV